jgi:hypothetical protein
MSLANTNESVNSTDTMRLLKPLVHELLLKQGGSRGNQSLNKVVNTED